jgi:hypothetical protein
MGTALPALLIAAVSGGRPAFGFLHVRRAAFRVGPRTALSQVDGPRVRVVVRPRAPSATRGRSHEDDAQARGRG